MPYKKILIFHQFLKVIMIAFVLIYMYINTELILNWGLFLLLCFFIVDFARDLLEKKNIILKLIIYLIYLLAFTFRFL
ncbi:MAG: hypothetical protein JJT76_15545 [Clostridiaceae bacterium]|nr:hypothetical protein [Clostridiaceae bacterium]